MDLDLTMLWQGTVLSQTDVAFLATSTNYFSTFNPTPTVVYDFDHYSGSGSVQDHSGNGNHGHLHSVTITDSGGVYSVPMTRKCSAGYYGPDGGLCTSCPANAISAAGSNEQTDCMCNAGYFGVNGGACLACPTGSYSNVSGSTICSDCGPQNDYQGDGCNFRNGLCLW